MNIFSFSFTLPEDRYGIWLTRVWHVKNHLLVLKEWDHTLIFQELDFINTTALWIRAYGIHSVGMKNSSATTLATLAGQLIQVDESDDEFF